MPLQDPVRFDASSGRIVGDYTIEGLMAGAFGTARFMEAARRAGHPRKAG